MKFKAMRFVKDTGRPPGEVEFVVSRIQNTNDAFMKYEGVLTLEAHCEQRADNQNDEGVLNG